MEKQMNNLVKRYPTQLEIIRLLHLIKIKLLDQFKQQLNQLRQNGVIFTHGSQPVKILLRMESLHQRLISNLVHISSPTEGWKIYNLKDNSWLGLKINGSQVQMRLEIQLSAKIQNLMIMIYMVHLYSQWVIFCQQSINAKQIDELQKIVFVRLKMPFLSQRCAFINGLGVDRVQFNNSILIYCQGITQNEEYCNELNIDRKSILKHDKYQVLDIKQAVMEITHKDGKFYLKCYGNIDIRISMIPQWVINQIMKLIGKFAIEKLTHNANNFEGSIWEKQIKQNQNNIFYKWLTSKMEGWLK